MIDIKKEISRFFVWFRNGFCFCTSWFLVLRLLLCYASGDKMISAESLAVMLLWIAGGTLIFCVFFTRLFIRRWGFSLRLTAFMVTISIYECPALYSMGVFSDNGTLVQWLIFVGVILVLYFICIGIYRVYSRRQGELFTNALRRYQQERSMENG